MEFYRHPKSEDTYVFIKEKDLCLYCHRFIYPFTLKHFEKCLINYEKYCRYCVDEKFINKQDLLKHLIEHFKNDFILL